MPDFHEALNVARKEVEKIIESDPGLDVSEIDDVRLERENETFWTFAADIPKLMREGWVPGAVIVLVDKKDGHVWTEAEEAEFHKNWDNTRRRAGFLKR